MKKKQYYFKFDGRSESRLFYEFENKNRVIYM